MLGFEYTRSPRIRLFPVVITGMGNCLRELPGGPACSVGVVLRTENRSVSDLKQMASSSAFPGLGGGDPVAILDGY